MCAYMRTEIGIVYVCVLEDRVWDRVSVYTFGQNLGSCECGHSFLLCVSVCKCKQGFEWFEYLYVWTEFDII